MLLGFAAGAALLLLLCAAPVKLALALRVCGSARAGAGLSLLGGRAALRRAARRARRPGRRARAARVNLACALPAALRALRYLLRRLHLEALRAQGRVGARDAAHTALLCGGARALEGALAPLAPPGAVRFELEPDFRGAGSDAQLLGMVSLRLGHIIIAALLGAAEYLGRRFRHGKAPH